MSKRKKGGIGALNATMQIGSQMLAEGLGGIGGSYVSKVGTYSPVLPDQAGAIASIVIGGIIKAMMRTNIGGNFGGGMVAVGFADLAKSFGIGGVEIINGTIDKETEARMIADYQRRKAMGDVPINSEIINGLLRDNAVATEKDLY